MIISLSICNNVFPMVLCFLKIMSKELVQLWIGLDILDSCDQRKRLEDVGLCYLNDLVNCGFFKKNEKEDGSSCYVMHDLLHELAVKVSSSECLRICSSNVKYIQSPPSVRHLSIIIDDGDVNDRLAFEDFKRDLSSLGEKLKVENLKTLMLFGEYQGCFAKSFGALFAEAKSLRVILLSGAYYRYIVEDVLHNLPRLVHLRYLRITPSARLNRNISRLYHLRVIDVDKNSVHLDFPRDMSNLINVRHFLVQDRDLQYRTRTFGVGKLELLQDLRSFMVKKEDIGFEFRQIGRLAEFGESLRIHGIENVERQKEANEAKLMHKINLQKLMLQWGIDRHNKDPAQEDHVLENLKPHRSLVDLHIGGHGGATCPSWLGENLSVKILESLCLVDVAWSNFPPLGELWFANELGEEHLSGIPSQSFQNLKKLKLVKIPRLRKCVGNSTCHLFSHLEVLIVKVCAELLELPFPGCKSKQEANTTWFPRLRKLEIEDCPKLLILPPVPWTRDPCSATIARAGSCFEELSYYSEKSRSTLSVKGKEGGLSDSKFWNVLALRNLTDLEELEMSKCPPLPLDHLQMLTSLKILKIYRSDIFL
uniref:Disease resistance RPP13-like protein 1 n=1 Tax=Triticum urartu TaxID=4572 RepID=A0A8R7QNW4_TRIUA